MANHSVRDLLIYGAGGQAKVVRSVALLNGGFRIAGFIVDHDFLPDETFCGAPLIRFEDLADSPNLTRNFIVGIGDSIVRQEKTRQMELLGFDPATVIHPFSSIGVDVKMGRGVLICSAASIDPEVTVEDGVIMNVGSAVGHESRLGAFGHVGAGAFMGAISDIGDRTVSGMGATVISGVNVGRDCFLAAGAMVTKDVPDNMLAVGSPARFRSRAVAVEV